MPEKTAEVIKDWIFIPAGYSEIDARMDFSRITSRKERNVQNLWKVNTLPARLIGEQDLSNQDLYNRTNNGSSVRGKNAASLIQPIRILCVTGENSLSGSKVINQKWLKTKK